MLAFVAFVVGVLVVGGLLFVGASLLMGRGETQPPAELAFHPVDGPERHELFLMCDDIRGTVEDLASRGAEFVGPVTEEGFGLLTQLRLPGGGLLGLYEPRHDSPLAAFS